MIYFNNWYMEVVNLADINIDDLDYNEEGKLVDKNGREVIMDDYGNLSYAESADTENQSSESESTDNLDDLSSDDIESGVIDMSYTGYSSDSEGTVLERESEDTLDSSSNSHSNDEIDNEVARITSNDFIDDSGNIVVMSSGDVSNTFGVNVVNYKNIAVPSRIRSGRNVEDLVKSIESTGLLNPLVVAPLITDGKYVLIDGYRRLLACVRCGITDIPVVINNKIKTTEVPVLEALYNRSKKYTMKDMVDYINYL